MESDNLIKMYGSYFHSIHLRFRKKLEHKLKGFEVTSSYHFGIMLLLSQKQMSQKEIANSIAADEPTITRVLNKMIMASLIEKRQNPKDKRAQIVSLTQHGKKLLEKIIPIAQSINQEVNDLLDPKEQKELLRILDKINSNI